MKLRDRIVEMGQMGFRDPAEVAKVLDCSLSVAKATLNQAGLRPYVNYARRHKLRDAEAAAIKRGIIRHQAVIQRLELRLKEIDA